MKYSTIVIKASELMTGELAARVLGVATFAVLARALGVAGFGMFAFGMSVALISVVAVDMGQNTHLQRKLGGGATDTEFGQIVANKIAIGVVLAAAGYFVAPVFNTAAAGQTVVGLMILWGTALSILDTMRSVARSAGLMKLDSAANAGESVARFLVVILGWKFGASVQEFAALFVVEAVFSAICFYLIAASRLNLRQSAFPTPQRGARILQESAGLGLAALVSAGFYRFDQLLVMRYLGSQATGLYDAATRVVFAGTVTAAIVGSVAYPEMSRCVDEPIGYGRVLRRSLVLAAGIGSLTALVMVAVATPIVRLLYGAGFESAAPVLVLLSPVVAVKGVTAIGVYSAAALHREHRTIVVIVLLLGLSVVANILLLRSFGLYAAALISSGAEVLLALGVVLISRDRLSQPLVGTTP